MKKIITTIALVIGFTMAIYAQPRAIGARLGYSAEVTYQHQLGSNMFELEVGLPGFYNGIEAVGTYDWIFPINSWAYEGSWNWYAGVGAGVGFSWRHNYANFGVAGRIGVEYNFEIPLQLSMDYRPVIGPRFHFKDNYDDNGYIKFNDYGLYSGAIALSIRYVF